MPVWNSMLIIFVSVDGQQIKMTEDHKISSHSERLRMEGTGEPLKDGETRLYGMKEEKVTETKFSWARIWTWQLADCGPWLDAGINLARMLGDKFLKQQDSRFSSEPYISEAVHIHQSSKAFALLARWFCFYKFSIAKCIFWLSFSTVIIFK